MNLFYQIALTICFQDLVPNPFTVNNLPIHQQEYILKAVEVECKKRTEAERLIMCASKNFEGVDCEYL